MKKKLIFIALLCLSIMACNDDASGEVNTTSSAQENAQKTSNSPLENFRLAINEMNQPKYFPTKEYTAKYGSELSDERKQILFEPGKQLIYSTGITEKQLMTETKGDVNAILNKAFAVYVSQTSPKKQ